VNIADDVLAVIACDALDRFADDSAAKVPDVQGLGYIGTAVVQNDRSGLFRHLQSKLLFFPHLREVGSQKGLLDRKI
jgi:hypothetical protein